MEVLNRIKAKCDYPSDLFNEIVHMRFPEDAIQYDIDNLFVNLIAYEYKPNVNSILRLAAITKAVKDGYFGGDFKVLTCPSVKDLIMTASTAKFLAMPFPKLCKTLVASLRLFYAAALILYIDAIFISNLRTASKK